MSNQMNKKSLDQIRNLLLTNRVTVEDIRKAKDIICSRIPKRLFKYRIVNEFSISNFKEETLWLTKPTNFNDPYDTSLHFELDQQSMLLLIIEQLNQNAFHKKVPELSQSEKDEILKNKDPYRLLSEFAYKIDREFTAEHYYSLYQVLHGYSVANTKQAIAALNDIVKLHQKICALSERLDSILMWSHYSNNHRGFVLEFDFRKISSEDTLDGKFLWPVIYQKKMFDASEFINSYKATSTISPVLAVVAAIHKGLDWRYEKEWRIVVPCSSHLEEPSNYKVPKPTALYLGSMISTTDKEKLCNIANSKGIPIFQMKLADNKFYMKKEKIK